MVMQTYKKLYVPLEKYRFKYIYLIRKRDFTPFHKISPDDCVPFLPSVYGVKLAMALLRPNALRLYWPSCPEI
jgi:hypothetical protein